MSLMPLIDQLTSRYAALQARIVTVCASIGRDPSTVRLLAVSKGQPHTAIRALYEMTGHRDFGENYVAEATPKQAALTNCPLTWHFIGQVQTNKAATLATQYSWVHSCTRLKELVTLNAHRPARLPQLLVLLQVNIDDEASKNGLAPDNLGNILADIASTPLPHVRLCGVMTLPQPRQDVREQQQPYQRLDAICTAVNAPPLLHDWYAERSFGTSADLTAAIMAGATIVRVGTALFGPRHNRPGH